MCRNDYTRFHEEKIHLCSLLDCFYLFVVRSVASRVCSGMSFFLYVHSTGSGIFINFSTLSDYFQCFCNTHRSVEASVYIAVAATFTAAVNSYKEHKPRTVNHTILDTLHLPVLLEISAQHREHERMPILTLVALLFKKSRISAEFVAT